MTRPEGKAKWPASSARARVFLALLEAGSEGLTNHELRARLALTASTVGSTLSNLVVNLFAMKHDREVGRFVVVPGADEHVIITGDPCLADKAMRLLAADPRDSFELADALASTFAEVDEALAPLVDKQQLVAEDFSCERGRAWRYRLNGVCISGGDIVSGPLGVVGETSPALDGPRDDFSCAMYDSGALLISSNDVRMTLPAEHARRLVRYLDCISRDLLEQMAADAETA